MKIRTLVLAGLVFLMAGCATVRTVTISTKPTDAVLRIDDVERGPAPITEQFVFNSPADVHVVTASRPGYRDATVNLSQDYDRKDLFIELKPQSKVINVTILPGPGLVSIDGKPVSAEPISTLTRELEFTMDARNNWTTHTISVERQNFQPASIVVRFNDRDSSYVLNLAPLSKNISVTTNPPNAEVLLDFQKIGVSPVTDAQVSFPVDLDTNEFKPRKLRAEKAGYEPTEIDISWDGGKMDYSIDLLAKTKTVRFITDPPAAVVKIDGVEVAPDRNGVATRMLQFPPINEKGDLKTYTVTISKKTADSEWEPQTMTLAWENGRSEYSVSLKEILTRPVQMLTPALRRADAGWELEPQWIDMLAMKDVTESEGRSSPQQMTRLAAKTQIGSLALAPDGSRIVFTVLTAGQSRGDFRSQMLVINTDGSGGAEIVSDGKSLDIMPSYTPGGDQIVFASNRAGRRMNLWSMSALGAPGVTRLTTGDTCDLWPSVDSDPKPRLFYQAMVETRPDARLYMTQLGTIFMTDLTTLSGAQPRVSPKNDFVLFASVNEKTGKRDIYRMSDRGGAVENLTNTPDADEYDANWNKDGSKIVFASDRVEMEGRVQSDIWMLDLTRPNEPAVRVTANASHDDCPVFDVSGSSIFFRSNRGGQWQIWRISTR